MPAGGTTPTFTLTVSIVEPAEDAALAGFPRAMSIDCYATLAEAERWHAIDEEHVAEHGYGRNHWT